MTTLYITETEAGYEMEADNGEFQGVADTLKEAIESAKQFVELGIYQAWVINE